MHVAAPELTWYWPTEQLVHVFEPENEHDPARQVTHAVEDDAPVEAEY